MKESTSVKKNESSTSASNQKETKAPEELKPASLMFASCQSLEPGRSAETGQLSTLTLEHVFSWLDEWKTDPATNQEMNFFGMPMLTDGHKMFLLGRQRSKQQKSSKCLSLSHSYLYFCYFS